jgi:hypothetical protein
VPTEFGIMFVRSDVCSVQDLMFGDLLFIGVMQRLSLNFLHELDVVVWTSLVLSHMVHALNHAQLISCRAIYAPEHVMLTSSLVPNHRVCPSRPLYASTRLCVEYGC